MGMGDGECGRRWEDSWLETARHSHRPVRNLSPSVACVWFDVPSIAAFMRHMTCGHSRPQQIAADHI